MKAAIANGVSFALLVALFYVSWVAFAFGQERFLTIDEFQWGHATWLIAQGQAPYRDFYEHHLPLGYLLHSVFFGGELDFTLATLLLRKIAFFYLLLAAGILGLATWITHRDPHESLLAAVMPLGIGFGLMSAIEYRGDNWSAVTFLLCAGLIEINRTRQQRGLSLAAGALFGCAVLMTQKILLLGGFVLLAMVLASLLTRRPWAMRLRSLFVPQPGAFCLAAGAVLAVFVLWCASLGILGAMFEINVVQAFEHERVYPGFDFRQYLDPFLAAAPGTTLVIALLALAYVPGETAAFWIVLLIAAALGGTQVTAPFPYNFVLACFLLGLCAARGCGAIVRRLERTGGAAGAWAPALYLLPLLLLPSQLGFLAGTTTNQHQLALLERIEALTDENDVVIDSAGSALFRPHRGYYWYQDRARTQMFVDYFENDFVEDLRKSQALFWIQSRRFRQLPPAAREYLLSHYILFDGELRVLGFDIPRSVNDPSGVQQIDVVRSGDYHLSLHPRSAPERIAGRTAPWREDLLIDGQAVDGDVVHLEVGSHRVEWRAGSARYRLSYLPVEAFGDREKRQTHTMLFEFDPAQRP